MNKSTLQEKSYLRLRIVLPMILFLVATYRYFSAEIMGSRKTIIELINQWKILVRSNELTPNLTKMKKI